MTAAIEVVVLLASVSAVVGWLGGRASTARERRALRRAATHDPLTELANRAGLLSRAGDLAERPGTQLALFFIDLDGFKGVNDRYGHAAGDEVLVQAARRLQSCVGKIGGRAAIAARLGGDEFAVLLPLPGAPSELEAVSGHAARAMRDALSETYLVPVGPGVRAVTGVGASIGVTLTGPDGCRELSRLLDDADAAMYLAKRRGGGSPLPVCSDNPIGSPIVLRPSTVARPGAAGPARVRASLYGRRPTSSSLNRHEWVVGPTPGQHAPEWKAS